MCDQEQRWSELCRRCGATTGADEGWARLVALYSTPPRAYHNLNHVEDCLRQLERLNDWTKEIEALEMAPGRKPKAENRRTKNKPNHNIDRPLRSVIIRLLGSLIQKRAARENIARALTELAA